MNWNHFWVLSQKWFHLRHRQTSNRWNNTPTDVISRFIKLQFSRISIWYIIFIKYKYTFLMHIIVLLYNMVWLNGNKGYQQHSTYYQGSQTFSWIKYCYLSSVTWNMLGRSYTVTILKLHTSWSFWTLSPRNILRGPKYHA